MSAITGSELDDIPADEYEDICYEEEGEDVYEEEPEVYYSEDFISGPKLSKNATLPGNILEFDYSFGYDCKRFYNLCVADENTLIFATGNLINFFNCETKELTFRRSAFGGGIGHITVKLKQLKPSYTTAVVPIAQPRSLETPNLTVCISLILNFTLQKNPNSNFSHIAIAENGRRPPIIIYDWPSLEIVCVLKGGALRCYTHLNYSPDGMLLASQGGEPDFLITIYTWTKSRILLRTKSNVHEVYRVMFSPDVPGQLTTCGLTHIKFWKMAQTFTGLKLQADTGRFGKTEYCDILGMYPMPDEKVLSGSEWGNILMWDEGLIKLEVCRKLRKTCHDGPITQFYYFDGDLWTVGMDGRVRIWFYDTIDQADPPDDDRFVLVEPIYDFYTPGVQFMCIYKQSDDPKNSFYYAQDGNGGLWRIDLNTDDDPQPSEQLYKCHAGAVSDIAPCPWGPYLASLGVDGRLQIYQYIKQKLLFIYKYPAKGSAIIWLPLSVQKSGEQLIMGFDDGNVRVAVLKIDEKAAPLTITLTTIQITKPHNRPVTKISVNPAGSVLVTGGEDSTIFIYQISAKSANSYITLIPIGYIFVPGIVTYLTWHHAYETVVLVGCIHGHFVQVDVPTVPQTYTTITYILKISSTTQKFMTYKSQIRRDIKIAEIDARKAKKLEKKKVALAKVKADNPGLEIDEEVFLADSESEEVLEPLFIPEIPNRILWMQTTEENTIWLSMGGFDAGYIYEYFINQPTTEVPANFQIIYDGDDIEISSYAYSPSKDYLFLAMQNGSIRVVKVNPEDWRDWSDYWQLSMHDNYNGFIPKMCFSYDGVYFFTCGLDGNIFSFKFCPEEELPHVEAPARTAVVAKLIEVEDEDGYAKLSLEEAIVKAEIDRQLRVANAHKDVLRQKIEALRERFEIVLNRNAQLPPTQVIPRKQLEIDVRITEHLDNKLVTDLALVKRKLAFRVEKSYIGMQKLRSYFTDAADYFPITVESIRHHHKISTMRQRKLKKNFDSMIEFVDQKIIEDELKNRPPERPPVIIQAAAPPEKKIKQLEYFLIGLSPSTIQFKLGAKLTRLLNKYRARKLKIEKRQEEWDVFNASKPEEGTNDPDDEIALQRAIDTIGDFKLKSASDYKVPQHLRESTVKKYKQLLQTRLRQFAMRNDFNKMVYELRDKKVKLRDYLVYLQSEIDKIHDELSEEDHKFGPPIPQITDNDFLEKHLEVIVGLPDPCAGDQDAEINPNATTNAGTELKETPGGAEPTHVVVQAPRGDLLEKEILLFTDPNKKTAKQEEAELNKLRMAEWGEEPEPETPSNEFLDKCTQGDTPWEIELRDYRRSRKLFDQDYMLNKMEQSIKSFDKDLFKVIERRVQLRVDALFVDLHILTLHQELLVLKEFEATENQLQAKVHHKMTELLDIQDVLREHGSKIDGYKRRIEELQETEKEIQQQFFLAIADNKFYDFLRKIFKKKYRPPKIRGPDDDSSSDESSSSSDESEEADAGSIDSRDFGIIKLDENVCPKGCDPNIYNMTFELRTKRHGVELEIKDQRGNIDVVKKELDYDTKKSKVLELNLKRCENDLEEYMREKQKKLNEIMATVVLKLHQLQHLISANECDNVKDALVFSQATLSKLYRRVGELHNETLSQKAKFKSNITHLCRMKTDCKHMTLHIEKLKGKIKEEMKILFGSEIDIDELEEVQLKRMVLELRLSQLDIRGLYEEELRMWREKFGEKQLELAQAIQDNTARLELLALMNFEKAGLGKLISQQTKKKEHLDNVADVSSIYKEDLKKLASVVKIQTRELQALRAEIKRLTMKDVPPPRVDMPCEEIEETEPEEDMTWSYESYRPQNIKSKPKPRPVSEEEQLICSIDFEAQEEKPVIFTEDVENMARSIIMEMLQSLESFHDISKATLKEFIEEILQDILKRTNVDDMVDNLTAMLPLDDLTAEERSLVETTAGRLLTLKESQEEDAKNIEMNKKMLSRIIDETVLTVGEPHEVITDMIKELIEQIPSDYLLRSSSISSIAGKIKQTKFNKDRLIHGVLAKVDSTTEMVHSLLNKILEVIFGYGIDYLYYIKY